jgi:hypothetical protein
MPGAGAVHHINSVDQYPPDPISDIDANRKAAMRSIQTLLKKWKP